MASQKRPSPILIPQVDEPKEPEEGKGIAMHISNITKRIGPDGKLRKRVGEEDPVNANNIKIETKNNGQSQISQISDGKSQISNNSKSQTSNGSQTKSQSSNGSKSQSQSNDSSQSQISNHGQSQISDNSKIQANNSQSTNGSQSQSQANNSKSQSSNGSQSQSQISSHGQSQISNNSKSQISNNSQLDKKREALQRKLSRLSVSNDAAGFDMPAYPLDKKTPDEPTDIWMKELINHVAKLKAFQDGLITAYGKQAQQFEASARTDKHNAMYALLRATESLVANYRKQHTYFLIDAGFRKKIDQLLGGSHKIQYRQVVDSMRKTTILPFYRKVSAILSSTFEVTPDMLDSDDLQARYDALMTKIDTDVEKIYALYNNKLDPMDLINQNFMVMYALKGMTIFFIWFSLYLSSKIFQEKYVNNVFVNNQDPPSLYSFVGVFLGFEVGFTVLMVIILYLLKYLFDKSGDFLINDAVLKRFTFDYVCTMVLVLIIGLVMASILMKKKYFRYKTDGLRGIRSLQEIMFSLGSVVALLPIFMYM